MIGAAGLTALGLSAVSRGTDSPGAHATSPPPRAGSALQLVRYTSCADLLAGLRDHAAANAAQLESVAADDVGMPMAAAGAPTGASAPQYSTTDHEAGADEPSIVKTDGRRVVMVSHSVLRVVDTATRKRRAGKSSRRCQRAQANQLDKPAGSNRRRHSPCC
jgi:hypothetical protein